jgi:glutathione S-transferase
MKLYTSMGPNPRIVNMFLVEKGLELETVEIDLGTGENRKQDFLKLNPAGQSPALMLDNGSVIAETTVICDYLEELNPSPVLVGSSAEERANTRMWCRRIDLKITELLGMAFRSGAGHDFFKDRMTLMPNSVDEILAVTKEGLEWLDAQIEGRDYIASDNFSMADILFFCWMDFVGPMGMGITPEMKNLSAWHERITARPSAAATA